MGHDETISLALSHLRSYQKSLNTNGRRKDKNIATETANQKTDQTHGLRLRRGKLILQGRIVGVLPMKAFRQLI